jgi:hypothetical protein
LHCAEYLLLAKYSAAFSCRIFSILAKTRKPVFGQSLVSALNIIAPEKEIRVKKGQNLYLTRETLEAMRKRDSATGKRYRDLGNEVSRLVRRDKQDSNLLSLKKACNDPKVLWQLADQALGKDRPSLPASITGANGHMTTPMEAADVMNQFFIDKVDKLRKKALLPGETPDVAGEVPHVWQDTGQVPQEAPHVAQEVNDVLQEANDDTMLSSQVPPSTSSLRTRRGHRRR